MGASLYRGVIEGDELVWGKFASGRLHLKVRGGGVEIKLYRNSYQIMKTLPNSSEKNLVHHSKTGPLLELLPSLITTHATVV